MPVRPIQPTSGDRLPPVTVGAFSNVDGPSLSTQGNTRIQAQLLFDGYASIKNGGSRRSAF
jgi:hypothetical protein